jgi:hypothetical protein
LKLEESPEWGEVTDVPMEFAVVVDVTLLIEAGIAVDATEGEVVEPAVAGFFSFGCVADTIPVKGRLRLCCAAAFIRARLF